MHLFGVEFYISAVIGGDLRYLFRVAVRTKVKVRDNVYRIVFYYVYNKFLIFFCKFIIANYASVCYT